MCCGQRVLAFTPTIREHLNHRVAAMQLDSIYMRRLNVCLVCVVKLNFPFSLQSWLSGTSLSLVIFKYFKAHLVCSLSWGISEHSWQRCYNPGCLPVAFFFFIVFFSIGSHKMIAMQARQGFRVVRHEQRGEDITQEKSRDCDHGSCTHALNW